MSRVESRSKHERSISPSRTRNRRENSRSRRDAESSRSRRRDEESSRSRRREERSRSRRDRSSSRSRRRHRSNSRASRSRSGDRGERHRKRKSSRSGWDIADEPDPNDQIDPNVAAAQKALQEEQDRRVKCRIYIGNIFYDVSENDVASIFGAFGAIRTLDMSKDPLSGRHKGYCFIEYMEPSSAETAVNSMNGFSLAGRPIKVGRPNAGSGFTNTPSSNALPSGEISITAAMKSPFVQPQGNTSIYVGNVDLSIKADAISQIFSPFGDILSCEMMADTDGTGKQHRGYGFIQFTSETIAKSAISAMDGFELAGRPLRVSWALVQPRNPVASAGRTVDVQAELQTALGKPLYSTFPGTSTPLVIPKPPPPPKSAMVALMSVDPKLAATIGPISRCVILKNLVSPEEAADPGLRGEIMEEAGRYGKVDRLEIILQKVPGETGVRVFVMYKKHADAVEAIKKLGNRYFGGNLIKAGLYDMDEFLKGCYDHL